MLYEDGTRQTSPLCKKIYTAELISSPVQVHQSEDSVQEQPTEPSSPFHPQLIQQSPNFPSSGNAIIDNSICSIYNNPGDGYCFFEKKNYRFIYLSQYCLIFFIGLRLKLGNSY